MSEYYQIYCVDVLYAPSEDNNNQINVIFCFSHEKEDDVWCFMMPYSFEIFNKRINVEKAFAITENPIPCQINMRNTYEILHLFSKFFKEYPAEDTITIDRKRVTNCLSYELSHGTFIMIFQSTLKNQMKTAII